MAILFVEGLDGNGITDESYNIITVISGVMLLNKDQILITDAGILSPLTRSMNTSFP